MTTNNSVGKEAILKAIWDYESDPARYSLAEQVIFPTMTEYSSLMNKEKDEKCASDHLSIDELLKEFTRRGFNTENWDGEEGAEKAIVDGVCRDKEEWSEKLFDKQADDQIKLSQLQQLLSEKEKEISSLNEILSQKMELLVKANERIEELEKQRSDS